MDTIYMKERAYRLVETLRRENKREQRRLDEKLFSKQGIAASHQMELLALTEEQRKVKQELNLIKKSSSTTWGLLPPRHTEPDNDEGLLWEMSNKRIKTEKSERTKRRSLRRPLEPSFSDSDISFTSARHFSDPGPSPIVPEPPVLPTAPIVHHCETKKSMKRLKKNSQHQLDQENKRTEETLKKFNEAFPSDGKVGVLQLRNVDENILEEVTDEVDNSEVLLPLRRNSRAERTSKGRRESVHGQSIPSTDGFVRRMSSTTVTIIQDPSPGDIQRQRSSFFSLNNSKRRESTAKTSLATRRDSNSLVMPKPFQVVPSQNESVEEDNSDMRSRKNGTVQIYPITVVDVQEARDNIVRRLVGQSGMQSVKRSAESPKSGAKRPTLSPIREQRTELNLTSASMPEFTERNTLNNAEKSTLNNSEKQSPPKAKQKTKQKNDANEQEAPKFDSYRYNPDGTLRTVHLLPDFKESLSEAMKARYIRHTEKQWFERELTVNDIFARD